MMKLRINGQVHEVDVPPHAPLLWVLRDMLDLKGTKFGCGKGLCGSCTVLFKGHATRSCVLAVGALGDDEVTTIEGLGADGEHPLQRAWKEHGVPQCGYCQSGQLMSAAALIEQTPEPTDEDIDVAMAGNICRCGTYTRIRAAIKTAAEEAAR